MARSEKNEKIQEETTNELDESKISKKKQDEYLKLVHVESDGKNNYNNDMNS